MNRQTEYRAWSIDMNKWIYGYYAATSDQINHFIIHRQSYNMMQQTEVIPESVGQWTGLFDKSGTKIYEGDVVERNVDASRFCDGYGNVSERYEVSYEGIELLPFSETGTHMDEYKVIGNLFQHPELCQ